jgi:hypothetical protein
MANDGYYDFLDKRKNNGIVLNSVLSSNRIHCFCTKQRNKSDNARSDSPSKLLSKSSQYENLISSSTFLVLIDKFRTRTKPLDEVWSNKRRGRCLVKAALNDYERTKERVRTRTNKQEVVVSCCRFGWSSVISRREHDQVDHCVCLSDRQRSRGRNVHSRWHKVRCRLKVSQLNFMRLIVC